VVRDSFKETSYKSVLFKNIGSTSYCAEETPVAPHVQASDLCNIVTVFPAGEIIFAHT
jgi:hypothetical protein